MEIRDFAERMLRSADIEAKLLPAAEPLTDDAPGPPVRLAEPARSADLQFAPRRTAPAMPKPGALKNEWKRGIAHHIMANHELQALEVMAWTLLAFPAAPTQFRLGIARIMADEQRHTRMHMERARRLGVPFGTLPVNCYIWKKAQAFQEVLDYIAGLPLVFEGANLDHTVEMEHAFSAAGDMRSAAVMQAIHRDEIEHVRFGLTWLRRLKPANVSDWDAWTSHLHWPLRPNKSLGGNFQEQARRAAGMSDEFLRKLRASGGLSPD